MLEANVNKTSSDDATVLGGRVRLLQPKEGLRAGLDGVMVAASVPVKQGDHVLDLGCGTGVVGLCVLARVPGVHLTGMDIQSALIEHAKQNAVINDWSTQCAFLQGDVRDKQALKNDHYTHVVCNPPYLQEGQWMQTPDPVRAKALGGADGDALLADWVACAHRALKPSGYFSVIHRADHVDQLLQVMSGKFGAVELWSLYPRQGADASRVIIRGRKNRKDAAKIHPGIILHEDDGSWTDAANAYLKDACAF